MRETGTQQVEASVRLPDHRVPGPVGGLVRACHPEPTAVVTVLVTALAAASGLTPTRCLLVGGAVLTGQLSVGWCNDRVDHARDVAAGRTDKPLVDGALRPRVLALAAGTALALCVPLSLAVGLLAGLAHLTGVGAAWAYNLGLKRTPLSWLPYALGFGLLPAFVALGLPGRPWPPGWAVLGGALLGVGAHLTNVLPDIEADLAAGVRGLPQRLGGGPTRVLAALVLGSAAVVLTVGPPGPTGTAGWAALGVTGLLAPLTVLPVPGRAQSRVPFLATLVLAATAAAALLARGVGLGPGPGPG
ncbi:UbiA family prenyltransferase [Kitasatospora sp. NBC_00240]|uniref:UbiA family prenyltransferase n=1 Tax=Kitasatospora sp. NBC_00240 TaxID=2903567 RepID=UPI00225B8A29|nr:UbiA family prenyltransferase [Kitasatospora sp. NBC_00240]MCX5215029.1 UbiA family prenyltransferase [Kitasatospora sp. NBC_00240]